jgi:hypothetical protein
VIPKSTALGFVATLAPPTNASNLQNALSRVLGLRPGVAIVTVYDTRSNVTQFYFVGPDAEKAASTLLSLTNDQLSSLLGLSGLGTFTLALSSLWPEDSVSSQKSRVAAAAIAVACANAAAIAVLLVIKIYFNVGPLPAKSTAAPAIHLSRVMEDGNMLPNNNNRMMMSPPQGPPAPPPPPGSVAVNLEDIQRQSTFSDLHLDFEDEVEL